MIASVIFACVLGSLGCDEVPDAVAGCAGKTPDEAKNGIAVEPVVTVMPTFGAIGYVNVGVLVKPADELISIVLYGAQAADPLTIPQTSGEILTGSGPFPVEWSGSVSRPFLNVSSDPYQIVVALHKSGETVHWYSGSVSPFQDSIPVPLRLLTTTFGAGVLFSVHAYEGGLDASYRIVGESPGYSVNSSVVWVAREPLPIEPPANNGRANPDRLGQRFYIGSNSDRLGVWVVVRVGYTNGMGQAHHRVFVGKLEDGRSSREIRLLPLGMIVPD